jgi:farnesyl diphosphate synthase
MDETAFKTRLQAVADTTERALESRLAALDGAPPRLVNAMRHAALGGGKRLRPFLLIETARLFGVALEGALPAAVALECVHCYSLIHDDLPSMDNDDMRRGRPTVHKAFDEATAILAGDALLTLAFEILGEETADPDPAVRARLIVDLARASGAAGMVGGQMLDLAAEGRYTPGGHPPTMDIDAVLHLQALKTGALFRFAIEAGALLGRAAPDKAHALGTFAKLLGQAFQLADDLLDAEGDAVAMGKAAGKDAAAGKATLIGLLGAAAARDRLTAMVDEACEALTRFGTEARILEAAVRYVAQRNA